MKDLFGDEIVKVRAVERDFISSALCDVLHGLSLTDLVGLMTNKVEAVIAFACLCAGKTDGQKISLLFNPHRLDTATKKSRSFYAATQDVSFCSGLARALAFKHGKCSELLYQCMQLGVNGVQYVNEFPPHVARDIYKELGGVKILDPCAGWGGRMIGAASVGAYYHGFEPSSRTHAGLNRLGAFLKQFNTGFDYRVDCLPFEDAVLSDTDYDIALTSPPYFDTELYSDESTQACVRYQDWSEFVVGFFLPMIDKVLASCKKGFILNIGSRQYPMRATVEEHYVCRAMSKFSLSGSAGLGKSGKEGEVFLHITERLEL